MSTKPREELYRDFIEFVEKDSQRERNLVNRRMVNVFFWCFLLPAFFSASILFLIKMRVIPTYVRSYVDWGVLIFPVIYSLYVLGNELLPKFPEMRKSGMVRTLAHAQKAGEWREKTSLEMGKFVAASEDEWRWIMLSFKMDLDALEYRNRYLTALAGAVFFLLMQGIDSLADGGATAAAVAAASEVGGAANSLLSSPHVHRLAMRAESSYSDFTQFIGLALFLTLLYLSGNQTYHSLLRYLNCAQLNLVSPDRRRANF